RQHKGGGIEPFSDAWAGYISGHPRCARSEATVAAARHIGEASKHAGCHRIAGGDVPRSVELPVANHSFQKSVFSHEWVVRAERQVKVVSQAQAVRLIEVRDPSFRAQIERILRDSAGTASAGNSRRIVD